jgi:hypothetical protein
MSTFGTSDRSIRRGFIGIMPVSVGRIVSFKYMNVVAYLRELSIDNEPTECLNKRLKCVRIAIRRTLALRRRWQFYGWAIQTCKCLIGTSPTKEGMPRTLSCLGCAGSDCSEKCENENFFNHDSEAHCHDQQNSHSELTSREREFQRSKLGEQQILLLATTFKRNGTPA